MRVGRGTRDKGQGKEGERRGRFFRGMLLWLADWLVAWLVELLGYRKGL